MNSTWRLRLRRIPRTRPVRGVEGSEQVQRALTNVLVLDHDRPVPRPRRTVTRCSRSRLERGLLVERQYTLMGTERARVQVADAVDGRAEFLVARDLAAQPVMDPPWFELLRREQPLDRRCRDRIDDAISHQRSCQFSAGPGRQRACLVLGQLAGKLDQVCRHHRGKNAGGARFEVRLPDRAAHAPRIARPIFGRSVSSALRAAPLLPVTRHRPASASCVPASRLGTATPSRGRCPRVRAAAPGRARPSAAASWAWVASWPGSSSLDWITPF